MKYVLALLSAFLALPGCASGSSDLKSPAPRVTHTPAGIEVRIARDVADTDVALSAAFQQIDLMASAFTEADLALPVKRIEIDTAAPDSARYLGSDVVWAHLVHVNMPGRQTFAGLPGLAHAMSDLAREANPSASSERLAQAEARANHLAYEANIDP